MAKLRKILKIGGSAITFVVALSVLIVECEAGGLGPVRRADFHE